MIYLALAMTAITLALLTRIVIQGTNQIQDDMNAPTVKDKINKLINQVAKLANTSPEEIKGITRKRNVVIARQVGIYIAHQKHYEFMNVKLKDIGEPFNRHHTTVLHSIKEIKDMLLIGDSDVTDLYGKCVETIGAKPYSQVEQAA